MHPTCIHNTGSDANRPAIIGGAIAAVCTVVATIVTMVTAITTLILYWRKKQREDSDTIRSSYPMK